MPGNKDPAGRRPAHPAARAAGILVVAMLLVAGCNATTTPSPSPSLEPTAEPTATPQPSDVADDPAADVDELITRLYEALDSADSAAFASILAAGAVHEVYFTNGTSGERTSIPMDGYDVSSGGFTAVEVTGEPLVHGDLVAVPVAYTYPQGTYYGFDVMQVVTVPGGLLFSDGATYYGSPNPTTIPEADALIQAEADAWGAGDADAVLALFTDDGAFWDGLAGSDLTVQSGDDLTTFVTDSVGFTVETVGDLLMSGTFVAALQVLTGDTASDVADSISVWEVRDGKIALHMAKLVSS